MAKSRDLEVIKKIEKQIGRKLEQLYPEHIYEKNCYSINENGDVIGLNLMDIELSNISPLKELTQLTALDLGDNKITDISPLKELTQLTTLDLGDNQITDISPLKELTQLKVLLLDRNQITDISPLKELTQLTMLDLSNNQITDISPLKELTQLTPLYLVDNQITDISTLKELKQLKELCLDINQITDISPLKELKHLNRLDLRRNKISHLPREITELHMAIVWKNGILFEDINLYGNPLESPPVEVVKQGDAAVRNYFRELEEESVRLLQSKLLIVGNGEVGKTTLMKKLKDNSFLVEVGKEETTHGINIVPWELQCQFEADGDENVTIHFWDFGGQDIYHATHQFFLTKRSLYLFVWEARKEEESKSFDYWLNIINLLSANSPVIVVMNKSDVRTKHIDEASIEEKFNNIVTFLQVSCFTGDGISKLKEQIRLTLGSMDHLRDKLPEVWMKIQDHLKAEKRDYISLKVFFEICRKYGLNEDRAEFLSDYLHDLGVILHYRHDKLLENTVILNPEWATKAVYSLVDTREIMENRGQFRFDDLKRYWDLKEFPRDKHAELVRLMEKFEICFPITGTDIHIVPELLPAKRPAIDFDKYKKAVNLHFEYHYDFMPEGIITRFISRMYYLIKEEHFWKNGVELRFEDSTALVVSELLNRKMKISVTGSCKSELLAIIRNDFDHIHQTLNMEKNKNYHELIPCVCPMCRESESPHFFQYEVLKRWLSKNKNHAPCLKSDDDVPIKELLTGLEVPKPKKDLLDILVTSAHHLQGIAKTIKPEENSRNGFITLLLSIHGFIAKDQTQRGSSAAGKSIGELDILIETPDSEAESVIEAFNLEGFNRTVIDRHLKKLFGYDPGGLVRNFIVVYSEVEDFLGLWKKYLDHIPQIDFKHKLMDKPEEEKTNFAEIKLARAKHLRQGRETSVYHLFINMKP
ncbi:COR domain-containing protein [Acidobacteriota bacterium]